MRQLILKIGGLSVFAIIVLVGLFSLSNEPNASNNSFNRKWNVEASILDKVPVTTAIKRIAGLTETNCFIAGNDPREIIQFNFRSGSKRTITLKTQLLKGLVVSNEIHLDSPYIYFHVFDYSTILACQLRDTALSAFVINTSLFTRSVQFSPEKILIRGLDSTQQYQEFKVIDIKTGKITKQSVIIPDQTDGGFSTDGNLTYDNKNQRFLYVQRYDNKIYCLDTNLNVLYSANTIDTTYTNPVRSKRFVEGDDGALKPSTPLHSVNRKAVSNNGRLFVLSGLRADNETQSDFASSSVIDIYTTIDGSYQGSIRIQNQSGDKLKDFSVHENYLIALFPGFICSYEIQ